MVVEGINSFPDVNESRIRLDWRGATIVHDLVRKATRWFDRQQDPRMVSPSSDLKDPRIAAASARLQAMLAWLSPGQMAVRLPSGIRQLASRPGSRILPRGAWNELNWTAAAEEGGTLQVRLEPEAEAYLLFDLGMGSDWSLSILRPGLEAKERLELRARTADSAPLSWSSASNDIPELGVAFPTAETNPPDPMHLTAGAIQELRALGYLN